MNIVIILINLLAHAIRIYSYVIIADALMSWFLPPYNRFRVLAGRLSAPVVYPFRMLLSRIIPPGRGMMIDFSPMLACIALQFLAGIIANASNYIYMMFLR